MKSSEKMKILLISIINSYKYGNTGVEYIAQYLRANSDDSVDIKYYHNSETIDDIKKDIPLDYDLYGCSVFETNYLMFTSLASFIKQNNKNSIVFFGGQFVTMNYLEIVKKINHVDYFILGDGEAPIRRLINHHRKDKSKLIGDNNIASNVDFTNKVNNIENQINSYPSYDYYINDSEEKNSQKTYCMLTKSNICTGACSFCCSRKGRVMYKSTDQIINEIRYLSITFGVKKYFFVDDDIFDVDKNENRERLNKLLCEIKKLNFNIVFSGFAKCKSVCNPQNYDILKKMSDVGFHHLFLGIDAGNESDRILYNKRSTLDEGIRGIRILQDVGISPRYGMIFINPYTTLQKMRENYRYLTQLRSSNYYHYGGLKVQLLSGTRLLEKVKKDNLLCENYSFMNTDAYTYIHPEVIPIIEFLDYELIPQLENVKSQFNTLKKTYELVQHINPIAKKYASLVKKYDNIEFELLKKYFFHLYEENDIEYCRTKSFELVYSMECHSKIYRPIINELKKIYNETPIYKKA